MSQRKVAKATYRCIRFAPQRLLSMAIVHNSLRNSAVLRTIATGSTRCDAKQVVPLEVVADVVPVPVVVVPIDGAARGSGQLK